MIRNTSPFAHSFHKTQQSTQRNNEDKPLRLVRPRQANFMERLVQAASTGELNVSGIDQLTAREVGQCLKLESGLAREFRALQLVNVSGSVRAQLEEALFDRWIGEL